jgi:uncharacterized protein YceK
MKHFKLSLITLAILISGCGGGSSSSTPDSPATTNEAKTVTEAEKNLNALSTLSSIDLSVNAVTGTSTKALNKAISSKFGSQKTTTVNCNGGGTLTATISDDKKTLNYSFNSCKNDTLFLDGEMSIIQTNAENIELTYTKLTIKDVGGTQYMNLTMKANVDNSSKIETASMDGVMKQTLKSGEVNNISFTNFVSTSKDTSSESWTTIDGTVALESKCTTGTYTFETIEKLVDATDGSDNTESGILKLNGATYTFENPYVTIKAGTESETIFQTELEKRMSEHNACSI